MLLLINRPALAPGASVPPTAAAVMRPTVPVPPSVPPASWCSLVEVPFMNSSPSTICVRPLMALLDEPTTMRPEPVFQRPTPLVLASATPT